MNNLNSENKRPNWGKRRKTIWKWNFKLGTRQNWASPIRPAYLYIVLAFPFFRLESDLIRWTREVRKKKSSNEGENFRYGEELSSEVEKKVDRSCHGVKVSSSFIWCLPPFEIAKFTAAAESSSQVSAPDKRPAVNPVRCCSFSGERRREKWFQKFFPHLFRVPWKKGEARLELNEMEKCENSQTLKRWWLRQQTEYRAII